MTKAKQRYRLHSKPKRYDPTRTGMIRRRFEADVKKRFRQLRAEVYAEMLAEQMFGYPAGDSLGVVNFRWSILPAVQAVSRFRDWLRSRASELVLGKSGVQDTEGNWTDGYIETAYHKGAQQAADYLDRRAPRSLDKTLPSTGPTGRLGKSRYAGRFGPQYFLPENTPRTVHPAIRAMLQAPVNLHKVELIKERAFEELKGVTEQMAVKLGDHLADGIVKGESPRQVARDMVKEIDDLTRKRALVIARTETIRAHAEGSLDSMELLGVTEVGVDVEWQATMIDEDNGIFEERVCPRCQEMAGTVLPIGEAHGLIPLHPNCVIGTTRVSSVSGINAVSKRWFEGDVFVVRTASNRELTCTPNHPILTDLGWIGAQSLYVGGNVVCDGSSQWVSFAGANGNDVPPLIHDVSEAFRSTRGVTSHEMPVSAPYFHGDGLGSKIAVIWSNSKLRNSFYSPFSQQGLQKSFVVGDIVGSFLDSLGPLTLGVKGDFHSPSSNVSGRHNAQPFFRGTLGSLNLFDLTHRHQFNSIASQYSSDYPPSQSMSLGQLQLINSSGVIRDNHLNQFVRQSGSIDSAWDKVSSESVADNLLGDSILATQILNGGTGPVFLDKVISIERQRFSGHVYNLETEEGFYTADGIVTHNCRCAWVPSI